MIDYYIYGYFRDINPSAPSVRKVSGNRFECCGQWWYYQTGIDNGKKYYSVTIPENGFCLVTKDRLKDAKQWIDENFDKIVEKLSTDEYKRVAMRFNELVEEAKENERRSENS